MAELNTPWTQPQPATGQSTANQPLAQDLLDLLLDCVHHRDDWMMERRSRLNIRDYKVMTRRAKSLEGQRLVALHDVRLGRATYTLIEVTDQGWKLLGQTRPPHYVGHGSLVHTVLISRVARYLKSKNWASVQVEYPVGPTRHPVDVFAHDPKGGPTAFEVTMSTSNVVANALNTLAGHNAVQDLIFLCPVYSDCRKVEAVLRKDPAVAPFLNHIQFRRVDEFIS
jgi:hypothetical protein